MKRYLLFSGMTYYPAGGWGDFRGDFDSPEEARAAIDPKDDWVEVIDTTTKEVLDKGD